MDELIDLINIHLSELENKALDLRLHFPEDADRRRQALEKITEREMLENSIDSLDELLNGFIIDLTKIKNKFKIKTLIKITPGEAIQILKQNQLITESQSLGTAPDLVNGLMRLGYYVKPGNLKDGLRAKKEFTFDRQNSQWLLKQIGEEK
jgi:hypothetical protein